MDIAAPSNERFSDIATNCWPQEVLPTKKNRLLAAAPTYKQRFRMARMQADALTSAVCGGTSLAWRADKEKRKMSAAQLGLPACDSEIQIY